MLGLACNVMMTSCAGGLLAICSPPLLRNRVDQLIGGGSRCAISAITATAYQSKSSTTPFGCICDFLSAFETSRTFWLSEASMVRMRPSAAGRSSSARPMSDGSEDHIHLPMCVGISMKSSSRSTARVCICGTPLIVKAKCWMSWCNREETRKPH